jgi:hypothetical protein
VWIKEMMIYVQVDRVQDDGHLQRVRVGAVEQDGDSQQVGTVAELGHNHIWNNVGMDWVLAFREGDGTVAELGHNHVVNNVGMDLVLALPENRWCRVWMARMMMQLSLGLAGGSREIASSRRELGLGKFWD